MKELKKLYGFTEFLFYILWFTVFTLWIFVRNKFHLEITNIVFKYIDIPFIITAIFYWLLTIRFQHIEENWENKNYWILDSFLMIIWVIAISIVLFIQFAYPDII